MTITYPLSQATFASQLRIASATFYLPDNSQQYSGLGGGQIRGKDMAPRLWIAKVTTVPLTISIANDVCAQLESLDGVVNQFYLHNPRSAVPRGGSFADTNLKINSIAGDLSGISLKGLPASYVLYRGDCVSFDYGATPTRAFHRILETVTANGSGVSPNFSVAPTIRPGAAVNNVCQMNPAAALMILKPGSYTPNPVDVLHDTVTFDTIQVIR